MINTKKEKIFNNILAILLFVAGSFAFWEFVYDLCNMIGAIVSGTPQQALVQLRHVLPFTLIAFILIYLGVSACRSYQKEHLSKIKSWKTNGIITIVLGLLPIGYVLAGIFVLGEYNGFIEGYPTPLFPLDGILFGAGIFVFGILSVCYSAFLKKKNVELPPYPTIKKKRNVFGNIFGSISYMISCSAFAGCVIAFWVLDYMHGNHLFNTLLWLNYFIPVLMFILYRFGYLNAPEDKKKKKCLAMGISMLVINILLLAGYFYVVQIQNEAPNLNAFGILPIEFTASFNAFPVVFGLNNILCPLVATIKGAKK